jgi:dienelactone hydrolase
MAVALFAFVAPRVVHAQSPTIRLPAPTGPNAVGTATFHWIDWRRREPSSPVSPRELVGQLWYPATIADTAAPNGRYAPTVSSMAQERAHAVPWRPPARIGPVPLVVVCPGRGVPRFSYTALAEDLASYGIAVLSLDLPGIGRTFFPDGREVRASSLYRLPPGMITGPYEAVDRFFEPATALGRADVAFALGSLRRGTASPSWFARLIDWNALGAFGHSLGGRLCGAAVADDPRFRALATMEGVPPAAERRAGFAAAVLLVVGASFPESALANLRELVPNRRNRVDIVRMSGFSHNAMTDDVVLDSASVAAALPSADAVTRTRTLLRTFFTAALSPSTRSVSTSAAAGTVMPVTPVALPDGWATVETHAAPATSTASKRARP